ncbi:MAG: MaoC family dehydratase [Acidimicrobiales bacterium]
MPIDATAVGTVSSPRETRWTSTDALLYAVAVGSGSSAGSGSGGSELEFTTENSDGVAQRVLPTFPVVVADGESELYRAVGSFDWAMLVHGEQSVELHAALPVAGHVRAVSSLTGIYDKGSGALVATETVATDAVTGRPVYTTRSSSFIRGEGGFGGDRGPSSRVELPERPPDHVVAYATRPDQALLYRLCGDRNPLHSDPAFAARAGFPRPILHGLCTYGFTGRAVLHAVCGSDPGRFVAMSARFTRPVYPGQELAVSIWDGGDGRAWFRTDTADGTVVDGGRLTYR